MTTKDTALRFLKAANNNVATTIDGAVKDLLVSNPELEPLKDDISGFLFRKITGDEFLSAAAEKYSELFSMEELDELTEFVSTKTGSKYFEAIPELTQFGAELGQKIMADSSQELLALIERKLEGLEL